MIEWDLLGLILGLSFGAIVIVLYPLSLSKMQKIGIGILIFFLLGVSYWEWGSWPELNTYHQKQARVKHANELLKSMGGRSALIETIRLRLKQDPKSKEGWYLLGRLYMTEFSYEKAKEAFESAHLLAPDDVMVTLHYAHSVWALNHEHFDEKTRQLLKDILQKDPNQADALAMLATDAYKNHQYKAAIHYWEHLLTLLPQQSDEAMAIRQALAKAQKKQSKLKE